MKRNYVHILKCQVFKRPPADQRQNHSLCFSMFCKHTFSPLVSFYAPSPSPTFSCQRSQWPYVFPCHLPFKEFKALGKHYLSSNDNSSLGLQSCSLPWGLLSAFILPDLLFYYHLEANVSFGRVDRETKVLKVCRHSYIFCL